MQEDRLSALLTRAEAWLQRLEALAVPAGQGDQVSWEAAAFRWCPTRKTLISVDQFHRIRLDDLLGIESQKQRAMQNTHQFVQGRTANNILLTGARGTGKSTLVKALLNEYAEQGLRVIQLDKKGLEDIHAITELIRPRSERFILYCDDLSFNVDEPGYQALKAVLDGDLLDFGQNLLIYATSNRRHLMPDLMQDNLATQHYGEEVHPAESVEEKVSLSDRFGIRLSFYPFDQENYLEIVRHWLKHHGWTNGLESGARQAALQWSQMRGSRSGRVAAQFARDWCGKQ